jgi:putative DNA methylase
LTWFDQFGFKEGDYGAAETLANAKNTSIGGLVEAGILNASAGKVQLLNPEQYDPDWDPTNDPRVPVWQMTQQLARANTHGGQQAGAELMAKLGVGAEAARELCYRLYTTCERKGWAAEAGLYNMLVQNWRDISQIASQQQSATQRKLF